MFINQGLGEKLCCSTLIKPVLAALTKIHLHSGAFLKKIMHLCCIIQSHVWVLPGNILISKIARKARLSWYKVWDEAFGVKSLLLNWPIWGRFSPLESQGTKESCQRQERERLPGCSRGCTGRAHPWQCWEFSFVCAEKFGHRSTTQTQFQSCFSEQNRLS